MFRVIVEVTSGSEAGRRIVVRDHQQVRFGRSSQADIQLASDERMSGLHFQISTDHQACYLQDLGSKNGTLVNHEPATSVVLRSGDVIRSGRTEFRVRIDGEHSADVTPLAEVAQPPRVSPSPALSATIVASIASAPMEVSVCRSGLTRCRGHVDDAPPETLRERLQPSYSAFFLLNTPLLDAALRPDARSSDYLFDWVGLEAAQQVSPILISSEEANEAPETLRAAWEALAVVIFFTEHPREQLLAHLREVARPPSETRDAPPTGAALGLAFPSIVSALLFGSEAPLVGRLFERVVAILIPDPEAEKLWQMFGDKDLPQMLTLLGMVEKETPFAGTA